MSNISLGLIVYFPLLIYELKNNFPSITFVFGFSQINFDFSFNSLFIHFLFFFELLYHALFDWNAKTISVNLFILFLIFLSFIISMLGKGKQHKDQVIKIFTNPILYLWILFIEFLLIKKVSAQYVHRIDVLIFLFFAILAIGLKYIFSFKSNKFLKITLLTPFILFFIAFFYTNFKKSLAQFKPYLTTDSIYFNRLVAKYITDEIRRQNFDRSRIMVLNKVGCHDCDCFFYTNDSLTYLKHLKFRAQSNDFFINQQFFNQKYSVDNYNLFLRYFSDNMYFLENIDYYFLICYAEEKTNKESSGCLNEFLFNLKNLDLNNKYYFSIINSYYLSSQEFPMIVIYLIRNEFNDII